MSTISSIASTGALENGGVITQAGKTSSLNMSDFFTLMAAQLQYQNPLEPTDNSQFMGQMAQFGVLEQITNLTSSFNYSIASGLVGKNVSFSSYDQTTGVTTTGSGTVTTVNVSGTTPQCQINGSWYAITDIQSIGGSASAADSAATTTA